MIEVKPKPCKGTGLARGYGCGVITKHRTYGLGNMCCYANWLLTSENGKIKLAKATIKAVKPREDFEDYKKERKNKRSLRQAKESTKKIVHEYVRLRDKGKPCVSCLQPWNDEHQAGHANKAELFETLKYNLHNINGQCVGCNIHKDGNLEGYFVNLPKRIGKAEFDELMRLASIDKQFSKVWNFENLSEIRVHVKKLIKDLKNKNV